MAVAGIDSGVYGVTVVGSNGFSSKILPTSMALAFIRKM
jgi:hypothetical protein